MAPLLILGACNKALTEPETADPIYLDIRSDEALTTKAIEDKKKEAEGFQIALDKEELAAGPLERKHTQQQLFLAKKTISLMEQDLAYFKLRAEARKALDHDIYPEIFKTKGKWPDPDEFERYKIEKRLREASRNWNDRVPRTLNAPTKDNTAVEKKSDGKIQSEHEGESKKD